MRKCLSEIAEAAKKSKVEEMGNLQSATAEKASEQKECRETSAIYTETIEVNTAQEKALEKAIEILGEGSAVQQPAEFLQTTVKSGFLSAHDPRKPLLDLLAKYGSRSTAGRYCAVLILTWKKSQARIGAIYGSLEWQQVHR